MTDASSRILHVTIAADPPARLDKALARDVPAEAALSRSRLAKLIADGSVSRAGAVVTDGKAKVAEGDVLAIALAAAVEVDTLPEAMDLTIVYEDDDLLVVDKPAGMVVHPAPGSPSGTLVNGLLHHFAGNLSGIGGEKRPGIVHRIDKDTSGLLVVAKSDAAHHGLSEQFAAHTVHRRYSAICYGVPDPADPRLRGLRGTVWERGAVLRIETQLARHRTDRQRQAVLFDGGRHAITRVQVEDSVPGVAARISCRLETGRTHQIRVHLAHVGHGLIGDPVYGGTRRLSARVVGQDAVDAARGFSRQALHAAELGFEHPLTGDLIRFNSPEPADMAALWAALKPSSTSV